MLLAPAPMLLAVCSCALLAAAVLPASAADFNGPTDVTLYLYTSKNSDVPETLVVGNDSTSPSFNPENPTKLFIHGWIASAAKYADYPEAYFSNGLDYNIVLVDWSKGAANWNTAVSSNTSILVGDYVGEVLNYFVANRGLDLNKLYIVGHSMGGQLAGIVGNRVGGAAAEVVGLDPANSLYAHQPLENQIDPTDAQFVQVIHTDAGSLGIPYPRGHVDFYPNGGSVQAGCSDDGCSHNIIIDFYLESITSKNFLATKCDSYDDYLGEKCSENAHIVMGENTPFDSVSGTYYLRTNPTSPYAEGDIGL